MLSGARCQAQLPQQEWYRNYGIIGFKIKAQFVKGNKWKN